MKRLVIPALLISSMAWSAGDGFEYKIHHTYQSPRALGMGDAFTAISDDYSALFYNPAALARRKDGQINMSLNFAGSTAFGDFAKDIKTASDTEGETEKQQAMIDLLEDQYGKHYSLRAELLSGIWVRPNWGFGIIPVDTSIDLDVNDQVGPAINLTTYVDTTIAYGYARDVKWIAGGDNSAGITVKGVNRGYVSKSLGVMDLVESSDVMSTKDLKEGFTVDLDFGFLYTPHIPESGFWSLFEYTKPTFSFVARNVLDYGFSQDLNVFDKEKSEKPTKLGRVFDIGSRWEYPSKWIFGGRGSLDIRDIGHSNFNFRKGLHAGLEFDWTMFSWWKGQYRVGINQGFLTLGASALFAVFNLDLVTYAEDVGTYSNPKENRIYMIKMNIDI